MVYWSDFVKKFFMILDIRCCMECHLLRQKRKMLTKHMIELKNVVISLVIQIFQMKQKV